jgi:hypothetical protein
MFISTSDAFKVSALIGALAFAGCGGDKSSPEEATGGTGASAGNATAGSTTGGAANAGSSTGGGGGLPPQSCSQTAPPNATISNFVPWNNGSWGASGDLTGGQSLYQTATDAAAAGFSPSVDGTAADPALHVTATVVAGGGYAGYVMWFHPCVDASAYTGISFDISGSLGGATLSFQVQMNDDYPIDVGNQKGACAGGSWTQTTCWNNRAAVTVTADVTTVSFTWAELIGGYPTTPVDPRQLLGIQWEANCSTTAACAVDLTLDNVQFTGP